MRTKINDFTLRYLPYFVFIMYIINRGTVVTQAMFMNCDHSMLTYRFYKTPKVILSLFKERLKTLIQINLLPAIVIAIGLPLILYLTGGTDNPLNYAILFISIIAMSIFFSVHYLILYYLLQPYNVNIEMKSSTYTIAQTITYFVCYAMLQIKMPTYIFGISTIIFSIIYCIISLVLVYKYAPKTFKLRIQEEYTGNRSAIHWDIVNIQTPEYGGGEIYFDDVLIRKDGQFVLKNLKALNPENLI